MSDKPREPIIEGHLNVTQGDQTLEATASGYDTDFSLWAERQADLLRRKGRGEQVDGLIDWGNLSEEVDALAKRELRELISRISTIIEHLAKLQISPADPPRAGWRTTIREARDQIEQLFVDLPNLKTKVADIVTQQTKRAVTKAIRDLRDRNEMGNQDPANLPSFADHEVLGDDWFPVRSGARYP